MNSERGREKTELTGEELVRYSRHILLPQVGVEGQSKLKESRVLLVGAGGLGFRHQPTVESGSHASKSGYA